MQAATLTLKEPMKIAQLLNTLSSLGISLTFHSLKLFDAKNHNPDIFP